LEVFSHFGGMMQQISNKKGVAFAVGGALIGSALALVVPGDMLTKFIITFPILFAVMIGGIYYLDKQLQSRESR
jgi:hypothetical protein